MKSIKVNLLRGIFIIILSTVLFLNVLIILFIKNYYYNNTEEVMKNQMQVSMGFYNKYFSSSSLIEIVYDNIDSFWSESNAQVELFDGKGNLLMDSIGVKDNNLLNAPDIEKALKGESTRWIGHVDYYENKVMAVSYPIMSEGEVIGIIRFITSMEAVDSTITNISKVFALISVVVLILGSILSNLIANSIINPIKYIKEVAEKMADGDLSIRSKIQDESEIGQLSNTLNFMANEIEKRDQLKNEFISSVSHELRTPLTAIKGWTITLNSDETDKETLKMGFNIIEKETDRLASMVEELLDFSKLINDKITLHKQFINIDVFLIDIKRIMEPRAVNERINLSIDNESNVGNVNLDVNRMKQVFLNILDNSFKFTDENGNIKLILKRENNNVVFIIEDDGCGIAEEDLPRVKEKFFKGKNSKSQNGIGLSICDEIIKLHKGSFKIESLLGVGTIVKIIIPIGEA